MVITISSCIIKEHKCHYFIDDLVQRYLSNSKKNVGDAFCEWVQISFARSFEKNYASLCNCIDKGYRILPYA